MLWFYSVMPGEKVRQSARMNHAQIKQAMADMAAMGAVLSSDDAIALVIVLVDRLEPSSDAYEQDMASLLRLGALIQRNAAD